MRSMAFFLRFLTRSLLLTIAAFALIVTGGISAQAAALDPVTVQQSTLGQSTGQASTALESVSTVLTGCVPGRDKTRVECNAVTPSPAHLRHTPANANTGFAGRTQTDIFGALLFGRIPSSLTHLDLGIVRT
ncbi:hypothetical protein [Arthrobacter alpinus]|uniref:hypothetical protein n=1 Tax=Arthrobacter alpinus TaxID=656366 RepID=UPI000AEC912F|nr:hypothetical protein [Arthrobacter alpinus]